MYRVSYAACCVLRAACCCLRVGVVEGHSHSKWLTISASRPTGVHAESTGASIKASAPKDKSKSKKKASNNRPKHNRSKISTDILKEWFYAHMHHPFPSDKVKAEFADCTGGPISALSHPACDICVAASSGAHTHKTYFELLITHALKLHIISKSLKEAPPAAIPAKIAERIFKIMFF